MLFHFHSCVLEKNMDEITQRLNSYMIPDEIGLFVTGDVKEESPFLAEPPFYDEMEAEGGYQSFYFLYLLEMKPFLQNYMDEARTERDRREGANQFFQGHKIPPKESEVTVSLHDDKSEDSPASSSHNIDSNPMELPEGLISLFGTVTPARKGVMKRKGETGGDQEHALGDVFSDIETPPSKVYDPTYIPPPSSQDPTPRPRKM